MMADTRMNDFLSKVINSEQYLNEVKQPSMKIKEMMAKRISYIQEIRVASSNLETGGRRLQESEREEYQSDAYGRIFLQKAKRTSYRRHASV